MNITFTGRAGIGGAVNLIPVLDLDGTSEAQAGTSGIIIQS